MTSARKDRAGRSGSKNPYAAAVRHSRRVWILKWAFPLAALLAVGLFVGSTMISRALPEGVVIGDAVIAGGKLIMRDPVMTGPADEQRGYSITAARAIQDLSAPSVIRLEDVVADFPINGTETALLDAISGVYDREKAFLLFDQPFTVTTEGGLTARLQDASIDVEAGTLTTGKRVDVETAQGHIVAQSLIMKNHGAEIVFERDVRMTLRPGAVRGAPTARSDE